MTALHPSPTRGLTIAETAESTGLTAHTLRYYERDGLMLHDIDRDTAGHRRYTDEDLSWIVMLTRLRSTGMPVRDVRRYAELVRAGDGNERARLDLLGAHRQRVLAQLTDVQENLAAIDHKIGLYTDKVQHGA